MNYRIRIHAPEGVSDAERQEAERRFEAALIANLGSGDLIAPVYQMFRQLIVIYGETPDMESMTASERDIFESWQIAETAAMAAAFGTHRYLDEGGFELTLVDQDTA
ncbi:hypothetical protein QWJ17_06360 [Betaproteobacteria bacterium LSUCC0117]|jgi:hypothetical protein|nr:hypothetical protein [Betaproteobacteria bacterium LSUCC0117]MDP4863352.1 hypothetical protein [Burkholderiaceae bacterium]